TRASSRGPHDEGTGRRAAEDDHRAGKGADAGCSGPGRRSEERHRTSGENHPAESARAARPRGETPPPGSGARSDGSPFVRASDGRMTDPLKTDTGSS